MLEGKILNQVNALNLSPIYQQIACQRWPQSSTPGTLISELQSCDDR